MKKMFYGLAVAALAVPAAVSAQFDGWDSGDTAGGNSALENTSIADLINTLMLWLLGILGFIAIIGFIIAGLLYITAAGDETKIEKAKTAMTYSIVGILVALLGWVILTAITTFLAGESEF